MVEETTIDENIICYFSEIGHKQFYYPTRTKGVIKCKAPFEKLTWLSTNRELTAIKLKNKYILSLTSDKKAAMLELNKEQYSVVWIKMPLSSVG